MPNLIFGFRRHERRTFLMLKKQMLFVILTCLLLNLSIFAQYREKNSRTTRTSKSQRIDISGGTDMTGEIDGAPYRLVVPASWNGTLIIYAHGYRDKADHPGETDDRNPDVSPDSALEAFLLGQGYALAGSAYKDNGWAVEEGYVDSLNLVQFFKDNVAIPNRILFFGVSMGTVIGFKSAETTTVYDGFLCACAVASGSQKIWDGAGDLLVAYDAVFGMLPSWGTPGDVRDDIDFETEVLPKVGLEVNNAANFPAFEFIRLVTGIPGRGLNPPSPPNFFPAWVATDMFFTTEARSELERRAGNSITQNLDRNYDLTAAERTYLMGLGVSSQQIDDWLAAMNNQRVFSSPQASRDYLKANSDYTGKIMSPVLTIHTIIDPLVTVTQESVYKDIVYNAGRLPPFIRIRNSPGGVLRPRSLLTRRDLLYQTYTDANGHCNFTGEQLIAAITALDNWVATKTRPTAADFPASMGFDNSFVPPPLNQP